jgi:Na+-translocating ferredoxin:NAD+ oxidoreductase RNF subunit RnfB
MNRTALTVEIAAVAGFQLALAALLRHATERATVLETEAAEQVHPLLPVQRCAS